MSTERNILMPKQLFHFHVCLSWSLHWQEWIDLLIWCIILQKRLVVKSASTYRKIKWEAKNLLGHQNSAGPLNYPLKDHILLIICCIAHLPTHVNTQKLTVKLEFSDAPGGWVVVHFSGKQGQATLNFLCSFIVSQWKQRQLLQLMYANFSVSFVSLILVY